MSTVLLSFFNQIKNFLIANSKVQAISYQSKITTQLRKCLSYNKLLFKTSEDESILLRNKHLIMLLISAYRKCGKVLLQSLHSSKSCEGPESLVSNSVESMLSNSFCTFLDNSLSNSFKYSRHMHRRYNQVFMFC